MENESKIIAYITTDNGNGFAQKIGEFETIEDIVFYTDVFAKGLKLSFEYETK